MKKLQKCPNCQGELITKQVKKTLKAGVNTAIVQIKAEVCLKYGLNLSEDGAVVPQV